MEQKRSKKRNIESSKSYMHSYLMGCLFFGFFNREPLTKTLILAKTAKFEDFGTGKKI